MFLEKASKIVRLYFEDFPEFETSWFLKATWENMKLYGDKTKVILLFNKNWITWFFCEINIANLKFNQIEHLRYAK